MGKIKLGAKKKTQEIDGRGGEMKTQVWGWLAEGNHTYLKVTKFFSKKLPKTLRKILLKKFFRKKLNQTLNSYLCSKENLK